MRQNQKPKDSQVWVRLTPAALKRLQDGHEYRKACQSTTAKEVELDNYISAQLANPQIDEGMAIHIRAMAGHHPECEACVRIVAAFS